MRRCLRAFLVGLLVLSLPGGPAHACWRSRQARHCRPVAVAPACPPPMWDAGCHPCGGAVITVVESCPPVAECCGTVVLSESFTAVREGVVDAASVGAIEPTPAAAAAEPDSPTVADSGPREPGLEPIAPPPALEPANAGVTPASNEQPMPAAPAADDSSSADETSVLTEAAPEMTEAAESPAAAEEATAEETRVPGAPSENVPATTADETPADAVDEPPMDEDTEAVEPAVEGSAEIPAEKPQPAPEEPNIFEELDAEESGASPAESREAPEPTADPFSDASEPTSSDAPAQEPAADPFGEPAPEEEMADEGLGDDAAPAEPSADEPEASAAESTAADDADRTDEEANPDAAGSADPFAEDDTAETEQPSEPAAADPFAAAEPLRRWIDATGTAAIVATLVDVGADGRCVLEARGRRIVVPVGNLSRHDQDYVRRAGIRLAKLRGQEAGGTAAAPAPAPTETAGL